MLRSFLIKAAAGWVLRSVVLAAALAIIGCDIPAQIVWSPDGSQAAYRSGNDAFLLNQQGIVLQPLGSSIGGFAWSADSKSLYIASKDEDLSAPTPIRLEWLGPAGNPATQPTTHPATQSGEPKTVTVVSTLTDGKTTPLFRLADVLLWHLQLSPDGQWLAAMTGVDKDAQHDGYRLFVYSIHGGRLYELSDFCGIGACFTGPNKLAFMEANGVDAVSRMEGHIVEVKLDPSAASLPRRLMLNVNLAGTFWMESCPAGLMFTAAPSAFPSPVAPTSDTPVFKLYHYTTADGGLSVLADDVGPLFDASPDGKRILFEKLTFPEIAATLPTTTPASTEPATRPAPNHDDLCVMNANGSDPHVLRALDGYVGSPKPPMWPAWRGNDQITFTSTAENATPAKADEADRNVLDVIQYRLTDHGMLEVLQSLSGDWKPEIKPYYHKDNSK